MPVDDTRATITEYLFGGLTLVVAGFGATTWALIDWLVDEYGEIGTPSAGTLFGIVAGLVALIVGLVCLTVAAAGHGTRLALAERDAERAKAHRGEAGSGQDQATSSSS